MNSTINLSYTLTTFNKLSYLKATLPDLLKVRKADEEIIISDGGSTDGTIEYLENLYKNGEIQKYISEKDCGESHGLNKAILLSKGKLIKIITDDDLFSYKIINDCKEFMLQNNSIDIIGFDGYSVNLAKENELFTKSEYIKGYKSWQKDKKAFLFCGLSFMIRRESLPLLGLFHTKFRMIDLEYSLRISSLPVKIAFHTGNGFLAIANPDSNSVKFHKQIEKERKIVNLMYNPALNNLNYKKIEYSLRLQLSKLKKNITGTKVSATNYFPKYLEIIEKGKIILADNDKYKFDILY